MDSARVLPNRVDALILHQLNQRRHNVLLAALHQQPLRVPAPEEIVVLESVDEFFGRRPGQGETRGLTPPARRSRDNWPLTPDPWPLTPIVHHAVNPPVLLVPQLGLVGATLAGLEAAGRGIVLHDVVVPIDDPHLA